MTKKSQFPKFDSFACEGDSITWNKDGYTLTARLERDTYSKPSDSDCYSKKQTEAWKNDDWFFVGVVVSVAKNEVEIEEHAASLWGIECNFPSRKKNPNLYLSEVAKELEAEALETAKIQQVKIIAALS